MDRQRFLRELTELKTEQQSQHEPNVCSRLYNALSDCLAAESKSVEAKLQVLTAALSYYTDLRPNYESGAPEADALGHYLFMECSRVVLGIEFHNLSNDDPFKMALKDCILLARERLVSYPVCHVFHILDWLLINQWSHPTLVAMMRGEDVDRESALAYVNGGEYPDLLRLRIQMLMESGCENYSLNLISWCVQSSMFESDVAIRTTHLLLLHRLSRTEDFHNQCCQIRCCLAKDLLRNLLSRGSIEDQSFLLLLSQTFLVLNWMKPMQFCCLQELLDCWLRVQRSVEPETSLFLDNVKKVASLTQDLRLISLLLDVLSSVFGVEFISFCTEVAVMMMRRELTRVCDHGNNHTTSSLCCHGDDIDQATATSLAQICRVIGRLYEQNSHMRVACLLTAFSLEPTDAQYYAIESCFHSMAGGIQQAPPPSVDLQLYISLSEALCQLRLPSLDPRFGWTGGIKQAAARRLEDAGRSFGGSEKQHEDLDGVGATRRSELGLHRGSSSTTTHAGSLTLDDIQQVLSCPGVNEVVNSSSTGSTGGTGGANEAAIDERALREITAYLQSEVGSAKGLHDSLLPQRGHEISNTPAVPPPTSQYQAHDSNFLVRLMPQMAPVSGEQAERNRAIAVSSGDVSGTILVTESNLPYLQQFLPNLQTVMQSVQSLVRAAPPQQQQQVNDVRVNGLQNCGPRLAAPIARPLPPFTTATDGAVKDGVESGSSKKRKRNSQTKSDLLGKIDSASGTPKSSDATKHCEPDSASSVGENGFVCDQCHRSFSKRLGLSVHVQRAHGHRRKSESSENPLDTLPKAAGLSAVTGSDDSSVKNCFVKHLGNESPVPATKLANSGKAVNTATMSACMCDSCGEIVSGLETHALVCVGRRSPVKCQNHSGSMVEVKSEQDTMSNSGVNPGAVIEMLQLAEHFLRQHVPAVSSSSENTHARNTNQVVEHTLHVPSPPPYRDSSELRAPYVVSTPTSNCPHQVVNPEPCNGSENDLGHAVLNGSGLTSPPGKEIVYEGTRMREFVEYQCDACLLTFVTSTSANAHVADHHNSASVSAYRVYACTSCALRYRDPRIMRHHVVYLCAGGGQQPSEQNSQCQQRLHVCTFCPKTFVSSEYLELHVRMRHSGSQVGTGTSQCILPAPPGVPSVPTLEQLTMNCRRPQEQGSQPVMQANTVSNAHLIASSTAVGQRIDVKSDLNSEFNSPMERSLSSKHHSPETPDNCVNSHSSDMKGTRTNIPVHKMDNSAGSNPLAAVGKSRSKPKGIVYKNVFMQCEGTYFCSECRADLTGREAKRRHRQLPCGDPKTASYSRRYTYLCPYCSERFPSQKFCRQHQIDKCLPQIGVPTAELGIGEHRCPLCPKVCFGFAALKGHMSQVHLPKDKNCVSVNEQDIHFVPSEDVGSTEQEFNGGISPPSITSQSRMGLESATYIDQSTSSPTLSAVCDSVNNLRNRDINNGNDVTDASKLSSQLVLPLAYESSDNIQLRDISQPSNVEDSPRPKRNRKSRSSEFFVMMFRNYPIMAKGVSMCRSCGAQLEANDTAEMHAPMCTGSAPVEVRRSTLFRCTHCSATFWRAKDCRVHQIESCLPAHGVDVGQLTEPSVACPMCNVRSYNRSGLMSHMKFRHELDTDGVRQVMDRCGIKKSIPPSTPEDITVPASGSNEPLLFDDGSHSFDGVPAHCMPPGDDELSSQLSSSVSKADTSLRCSSSTSDDLVQCVTNSTMGSDLLSVSNGETVADLDDSTTWQTAIV